MEGTIMKQKLRKVLATVLVICAISTITVYAEDSTNANVTQSTTSKSEEIPVITDEAKILSEHESDEIIENSKNLSVYSLAIYIESMDETELSEQATADNAKAFYQNVFGGDVYPSLEEKAANLLYFMIKDHPYADGCKRIAASLFLEFLARNNILYKADQKRVSDGALVAITLMIAESDPKEKDIMVNLVMNLLIM